MSLVIQSTDALKKLLVSLKKSHVGDMKNIPKFLVFAGFKKIGNQITAIDGDKGYLFPAHLPKVFLPGQVKIKQRVVAKIEIMPIMVNSYHPPFLKSTYGLL
jgi:hypothetical protein